MPDDTHPCQSHTQEASMALVKNLKSVSQLYFSHIAISCFDNRTFLMTCWKMSHFTYRTMHLTCLQNQD